MPQGPCSATREAWVLQLEKAQVAQRPTAPLPAPPQDKLENKQTAEFNLNVSQAGLYEIYIDYYFYDSSINCNLLLLFALDCFNKI